MNEQIKTKVFHGACPHDCPDTCAMDYHVVEGKLVEVRGKKNHPFTRGGLCVKLKDFHDHHANPDRLMYPLRRVGPKGSGPNGGNTFERITWDEAIKTIGEKWREIIAAYGSQAIMPYSYLGNMGLVQGINSGDPFFNRLGTTVNEKTFCTSGSSTAWLMTHGPTGGVDPESFVHSKFIVIWACNTISTNLHHWPFILEAQKRGAKIVVVDPYRSRTAKGADWHIMPRPGTDGALALGIINSMIAQGLVDQDYVDKHVHGFPELKARAADFTPDYVERVTGVKAEDVKKFAYEFATSQPSAIRIGVAIERSAGGAQASRAIYALPALAGSWRHVGGGMLQIPLWDFPVDWAKAARPDFIKPGTRAVNNLRLGQALLGEMDLDPPIKSLFVFCTNPVSQSPETNKIVRGLQREDLFTVAAEHFITDTAKYADIILPSAMAGEAEDMMWSWGTFYLTYNEKAVDPPGECKPTSDLWRLLAAEMGFDDPVFKMTDSELCAAYINWDDPKMGGVDMDYFKEHGFYKIDVGSADTRAPHAEGNFPTPSGKVEVLLPDDMKKFVAGPFRAMYDGDQDGSPVDPLPGYVAMRETEETDPELAKKYPLNIVTPKSHGFLNSCYANEPHKIKGQGEQFVLISPADAETRSIRHGDPVRVS
ncbi:molybdopterin-dependent oxidoreductase, partial [bacterium]|nr:molybdopterin-dependent oxidoreductase [bacterium]